jgi:hypothetical protein
MPGAARPLEKLIGEMDARRVTLWVVLLAVWRRWGDGLVVAAVR